MNRLVLPFVATILVLAACGDDAPSTPSAPVAADAADGASTREPDPATSTPVPTPTAAAAAPGEEEVECPYAHHTDPSGQVDIVRLPPDFCRDWPDQDWSRHTVPFGQIIRGCGARDCIVALDAPGAVSTEGIYGVARFAPLDEVDYAGNLPIGVLRVGEVVRGYPLHVLTFHEIVNDVVDGVPVVASFCPLCNTVLAFDRRVDGEVLDFGVSGNLRHSDLIMWDRQTETWWQQATGEGIVGRHAGVYLRALPMSVLSFADFKRSFPDADILTEETGFNFIYGNNPFPNYDTREAPIFFLWRPDSRLPALERVVALSAEETAIAVPLSTLTEIALATVDLGGTEGRGLLGAGNPLAPRRLRDRRLPRHRQRRRLPARSRWPCAHLQGPGPRPLRGRANRLDLGCDGPRPRWPPRRFAPGPCHPRHAVLVRLGRLQPARDDLGAIALSPRRGGVREPVG